MVKVKIIEIEKGESEIKSYGATNHEEFFAVASEYFFENPHLLRKKNPKLYESLAQVFNQSLADSPKKNVHLNKMKPKRNGKCICGSGLKFKKCCED